MVPLEAFLSEKPVLTTTDAGGPLEVVSDHATGLVVTPEAEEIARALGWLREHRDEAASFGRAGNAIAREVTWDRAIEAARVKSRTSRRCRRSRPVSRTTARCSSSLRERIDVTVATRRAQAAARHRRRALPRREQPGRARLDRRRSPSRSRRRRPHDFVLHHLVAGMTVGRRDGHATST